MDALPSGLSRELSDRTLQRLAQYPGNVLSIQKLCESFASSSRKRPIALVGAGASSPLPGWQALLEILGSLLIDRGTASSEHIGDLIGLAEREPLEAAGKLFALFGDRKLALAEVRGIFALPNQQPNATHRLILRLPFKALTTTNYDLGLTYAWREEHKDEYAEISVSTHSMADTIKRWLDGTIFDEIDKPILHLHGSIDHPSEMILDDLSYRKLYGARRKSTPYTRLVEDLWLRETLILIGFSGNDPILRRLAKDALNRFQWAGVAPQHTAILPLEPDLIAQSHQIRQDFYRDFHADIVFFDPSEPAGGGQRFQDLQELLSALARAFPSEIELRRRQREISDQTTYRNAVSTRIRAALNEIAPATRAKGSAKPIHELFWKPTIRLATPEEDIGPQTTDISVVYGEAGSGKTVLTKMLTLAFAEDTPLISAELPFPTWVSDRNFPLLIDLKKHAKDLLIGKDDPGETLRQIVIASWGLSAGNIMTSPHFLRNGIVIIDSLEALLWSAWGQSVASGDYDIHAASSICKSALDSILGQFRDIPFLITARPFAVSWLRSMKIRARHYELCRLNRDDIIRIFSVHRHGSPVAHEHHETELHLNSILHSQSFMGREIVPMIVKLMTDARSGSANNPHITLHQVVSGYYDSVFQRSVIDIDDAPPLPVSQARNLLRYAAFHLASMGNLSLSRSEIVECGRHFDVPPAESLAAFRWLGDRTELVVAEIEGSVSFTHDWYQETLAAEWVAQNMTPEDIVSRAGNIRFHETIKYAICFSNHKIRNRAIELLLDKGANLLAISAADQVWETLQKDERESLRDRVIALAKLDTANRLAITELACAHPAEFPAGATVDLAFPFSLLATISAREEYSKYDYGHSYLPAAELATLLFKRIMSSTRLVVSMSLRPENGLLLRYVAADRDDRSGAWESASLIIAPGQQETSGFRHQNLAEYFEMLVSKSRDGTVLSLARSLLTLKDACAQTCLLAAALLAEDARTRPEKIPTQKKDIIQTLIQLMDRVDASESPAFRLGIANVVLVSLRDGLTKTQTAKISALRRESVEALIGHYLTCEWLYPANDEDDAGAIRDEIHLQIRSLTARIKGKPPAEASEAPRISLHDAYISSLGHLIHKLKAKDTTGRWAYYFILVMSEMEEKFLQSIKGDGIIDLEDYGTIVASCYGEEPSDEIRKYLKGRYGFDT